MCFLRDITFDMVVYCLTEMFYSDHQYIRICTVFHAANFLRVSHLPALVPELGISNSKPCSISKSP